MPYESWAGHTRDWGVDNSELYDLTVVCDRCGVPVARHRTETHDRFHESIDKALRAAQVGRK